MDPERSGQQGGEEASYVPVGNRSGVRGSSISSGFRNSGSNKSTNNGIQGNRGGLEIKVVHTNIRTGMWLVARKLK